MTTSNGLHASGKFVHGVMQEWASLTFADGTSYFGKMKDDKQHGQGMHIKEGETDGILYYYENGQAVRLSSNGNSSYVQQKV